MLCKDRKFIFIAYPFVKKNVWRTTHAWMRGKWLGKNANGRCDEPARTTSSESEVPPNGQRTGESHWPTTA
jgi:hypothetical protein